MKFQKYHILIEKLFKKQITQEEAADLKRWLEQSGENEGFEEMCHDLWINTPTASNENVEAVMLENIRKGIDETRSEKSHSVFTFYKIAAVVLFVISIGLAGYIYQMNQSGSVPVAGIMETSVENGQKARLTLPDGTKVWLNSATQLTYDDSFNQEERKVRLNGEAYFEVAKNHEKRFLVECGGVIVEALGTTFNVKAYQSDPVITTSLIEGSVRVSDANSGVTLEPNHQLVYSRNAHTFAVSEMRNANEADYWRRNILYFKSTPLSEIAHTIERMYDVKVIFSDKELEDVTFSGTIRNNSLENILHVLELTYPVTSEFHDDTILLKQK